MIRAWLALIVCLICLLSMLSPAFVSSAAVFPPDQLSAMAADVPTLLLNNPQFHGHLMTNSSKFFVFFPDSKPIHPITVSVNVSSASGAGPVWVRLFASFEGDFISNSQFSVQSDHNQASITFDPSQIAGPTLFLTAAISSRTRTEAVLWAEVAGESEPNPTCLSVYEPTSASVWRLINPTSPNAPLGASVGFSWHGSPPTNADRFSVSLLSSRTGLSFSLLSEASFPGTANVSLTVPLPSFPWPLSQPQIEAFTVATYFVRVTLARNPFVYADSAPFRLLPPLFVSAPNNATICCVAELCSIEWVRDYSSHDSHFDHLELVDAASHSLITHIDTLLDTTTAPRTWLPWIPPLYLKDSAPMTVRVRLSSSASDLAEKAAYSQPFVLLPANFSGLTPISLTESDSGHISAAVVVASQPFSAVVQVPANASVATFVDNSGPSALTVLESETPLAAADSRVRKWTIAAGRGADWAFSNRAPYTRVFYLTVQTSDSAAFSLHFGRAVQSIVITQPTSDTVVNPYNSLTVAWSCFDVSSEEELVFSIRSADPASVASAVELGRSRAGAGAYSVPSDTLSSHLADSSHPNLFPQIIVIAALASNDTVRAVSDPISVQPTPVFGSLPSVVSNTRSDFRVRVAGLADRPFEVHLHDCASRQLIQPIVVSYTPVSQPITLGQFTCNDDSGYLCFKWLPPPIPPQSESNSSTVSLVLSVGEGPLSSDPKFDVASSCFSVFPPPHVPLLLGHLVHAPLTVFAEDSAIAAVDVPASWSLDMSFCGQPRLNVTFSWDDITVSDPFAQLRVNLCGSWNVSNLLSQSVRLFMLIRSNSDAIINVMARLIPPLTVFPTPGFDWVNMNSGHPCPIRWSPSYGDTVNISLLATFGPSNQLLAMELADTGGWTYAVPTNQPRGLYRLRVCAKIAHESHQVVACGVTLALVNTQPQILSPNSQSTLLTVETHWTAGFDPPSTPKHFLIYLWVPSQNRALLLNADSTQPPPAYSPQYGVYSDIRPLPTTLQYDKSPYRLIIRPLEPMSNASIQFIASDAFLIHPAGGGQGGDGGSGGDKGSGEDTPSAPRYNSSTFALLSAVAVVIVLAVLSCCGCRRCRSSHSPFQRVSDLDTDIELPSRGRRAVGEDQRRAEEETAVFRVDDEEDEEEAEIQPLRVASL